MLRRMEAVSAPAVRQRRGLTILELLVVSAIMSLLAAIVLPALGAVQESARRIECTHRLREIGVALHHYESQHGCLPAGLQWEATHSTAYGWGVPLLPCLEQAALASQVDRTQPVEALVNSLARAAVLDVFACPSDVGEPSFPLFLEVESGPAVLSDSSLPLTELPSANYFGVWGVTEPDEADDSVPSIIGEGAFIDSRPVRFAEFQRGLSQSLLVGERTMARLPSTWLGVDARGEDAACRLLGNAATSPNCNACDECEFGSRHSGGANFVWGDGRITFVPEVINSFVYREMARRSLP